MRETISNQSVAANNPPEPAADDTIDAPPNATPTTIITVANKSTVPLPAATSTVVGASSSSSMKRPLTLDLNAKPALSGGAKRQRFNTSVIAPVSVLNSPDLQILNQASPELEKFMTASNLQTPTPSMVYPTRVTTEQEDYAKGFFDALNSLHNCETSQQQSASTTITTAVVAAPLAVSDSGANVTTTSAAAAAAALVGGPVKTVANSAVIISTDTTTTNILSTVGTSGGTITRAATYTNLDSSAAVANSSSCGPTTITTTATTAASIGGADTMVNIKDEPVPSPPPHSPIDMNDQERIKLERKRQRNRVAASKCRKRKLERISKLEDKVKTLKSDNSDLGLLLKQLKENVCKLKQQVIEHINSGCNITTDQKGAATNGGAVAEADLKH